jgi:hypothetical protein
LQGSEGQAGVRVRIACTLTDNPSHTTRTFFSDRAWRRRRRRRHGGGGGAAEEEHDKAEAAQAELRRLRGGPTPGGGGDDGGPEGGADVLERLRELRGGGPAAAAQLRTLASAPLAPPLVVLWWSRMCSCAPHRLGRWLAVASLAGSTVVGARWRVAASARLSLAWGGRRRGTDSDPPCLVSAPLGLRPRTSRIAISALLAHAGGRPGGLLVPRVFAATSPRASPAGGP